MANNQDELSRRSPSLSVAVFAKPGGLSIFDLIVVDLDVDTEERGAADAVARGYIFCGSIAIVDGEPKVECEPGLLAATAMPYGGVVFAGMLGARLKTQQLNR